MLKWALVVENKSPELIWISESDTDNKNHRRQIGGHYERRDAELIVNAVNNILNSDYVIIKLTEQNKKDIEACEKYGDECDCMCCSCNKCIVET